MRSMILNFHRFCVGANEKHQYKKNNKLLWILCGVGVRLCRVLLCVYMFLYKELGVYPKPLQGNDEVIISLTSFPKRIKTVWQVVDSMFRQTMQPSRIYLYLSNEEFPEGRASLPKRLLEYEKLGLEICFCEVNLMPHNKYFYALQEHNDKCVITIDDDIYYYSDTVERLWKIHIAHPECVCSNSIHCIKFDKDGNFLPYLMWNAPLLPDNEKTCNLALGFNGVLYPPSIFTSLEVFNADNIKGLALKADDLWLKVHEILQGILVATGEYYASGIFILGSQTVALMSSNCGNCGNDMQWNNLCNYYGISKTSFISVASNK